MFRVTINTVKPTATQLARTGGKADGRGTALSLELHLSKPAFATGHQLSGVVILRLPRPASIRSLVVCISGKETPSGASLTRSIRKTSSFFDREMLLSGMEQPRFTSERVSQLWNAFLGRGAGRTLSAGEHIYPFAALLPASLPPTYEGRAGRIAYTVTARIRSSMGRATKVSRDARVVFIPRALRGRPVAVSYPNAGGTVHSGEVSVSLELAQRAVELGGKISGHFTISNPGAAEVADVTVALETCEWVRPASDKEMHRQKVDSRVIELADPTASSFEAAFELSIPPEAPPTVEGTAISAIWLVKLSLNTSPPVELKTPITVYAPLP